MLVIGPRIAIDDGEIEESFVRASGPGGQNVNKVATAVRIRFDVRHSPSLPDGVRLRLERLAGRRLTRDGVLVITAQRHRTREANRRDARDRLAALIGRAAIPPRMRAATVPTMASRIRRLEAKRRRAAAKQRRAADGLED